MGAFPLSFLVLLFHILSTTPTVCCVRVNCSKRDQGKFKSLKKLDIMHYGESPLEKSAGENLYAADIENAIKCDPLVKDAVVGGQGRARLFLLLDFAACEGEEFRPH